MSESDVLNLNKVIKDLYLGNGKPALTQRVATLEESGEHMEKSISKIETTLNRITWLIVSTVALALLNLVIKR